MRSWSERESHWGTAQDALISSKRLNWWNLVLLIQQLFSSNKIQVFSVKEFQRHHLFYKKKNYNTKTSVGKNWNVFHHSET